MCYNYPTIPYTAGIILKYKCNVSTHLDTYWKKANKQKTLFYGTIQF